MDGTLGMVDPASGSNAGGMGRQVGPGLGVLCSRAHAQLVSLVGLDQTPLEHLHGYVHRNG